jgi:NADPH-dependent glutamate synthase beta subunit-like oxidoreductase
VDARALAGRVAAGDWDQAWRVLWRTMPFPAILGLICDGPCEEHCLRAKVGGAIRIAELERAVVAQPAPNLRTPPMPKREGRVAVLGGGLSGLTVAWDLARKGYPVVIHEPDSQLGRRVCREYAAIGQELLDEAGRTLERLGVQIQLNAPLDREDFLEYCRQDYAAVYVGLDGLDQAPAGLARDADGRLQVESPAQTTNLEGVFAGGIGPEADRSPVWRAAQGRWAGTSIDRFLQGVSPTAGREKEGPFATRLFTSLDGVPSLPPVEPDQPDTGYTPEEAILEAGRCLQCQCLECVKVCAYLEQFGSYPRRYAREIYNNESIVMGERKSNKLVNSCSLCGLCQEVCPEDFAMQDLCLASRQSMVDRGKMPPSAHEFALLDMRFSLGDRFALDRHQPGWDQSAQVFFPGCQLAASSPAQVRAVYEHLSANLPGGVGLMLACCGAPAHWAGRQEEFRQVAGDWLARWQEMGSPRVITACSTCFQMFREHLPEVEVASLWPVLQSNLPTRAEFNQADPLAVHDPCTTRHEPEMRDSVRAMLTGRGLALRELPLSGALTECCGYGGLMQNANPDLAREVVRRRAQASELDYLTYCAVCRDNLAAAGKRALHMLDILFPLAGQDDPAGRARPGWSERRESRARLKAELLKDLWGEEVADMEPESQIKLIIAPEVEELLEQRRILREDIRQVIARAESSGERLVHPDSGHYKASAQPYQAVFWVEYSSTPEGYQVHNAYAHRMTVVGGGHL